jgi:peptide/nickel transport system substrate-binding protein
MRKLHLTLGSAILSMLLLLAGFALAQPSGTLVVALTETPPHLDIMSNTTGPVAMAAHHIYETLFNYDDGFRPAPMLVDTWESDAEGKVWTFTLRQGVLFHNGDEMTVDDVEASLNRWTQVSRLGRGYADLIFERLGDYSFRLVSLETRADMLDNLSGMSQSLVIMPAEIVNAAGANEITDPTQFIGTGPFMFVELVPDEVVRMEAFPDYVGRDEGPKVESLEFRIIKDVPTRTAALRAGEIDVIFEGVSGADKPTLEADPNIVVSIIPGNQKWGPIFNFNSAFGGNRAYRQAVAAAMDHEELGLAMVGDPDLFDVHPGLAFRGGFFFNEAGADFFDVRDQDRARALLAEGGYNGEEVVIISTKANIFQDRMATVLQAQLQDVGVNVRIDWYDGATLRQVRTQPDQWDIIPGGWGTTFNPGIYAQAFLCTSGSWSGFCDADLDEIFLRAASTIDVDERAVVYEELQQAIIEVHVPQILIGDFQGLRAYRSNLTGVRDFKDFRAWGVAVE